MPENIELTRRSFLKGALAVAALIPTGGLLAACSAQEPAASSSTSAEPEPEPVASSSSSAESSEEASSSESAATPAGPVLVAYFSATGNTENVANAIAEHLGADVFAITPVQEYTSDDLDYNDSESRTSIERSDPNRNVELTQVTPDGFADYQTVFVGYPIWWGDAAWVVDNFVAGNDFTGKTVVPFCTSASSPIGASGQNLASMAGTGTWLDGERFSGGADASEVAEWVDGLQLQ